MLERDIQKKCVAYARSEGWWASKFVAQGRRSAPDYIFAKNGLVIFVEFKRPGQRPTELQVEEHKKMRSFGLVVEVCDNLDHFQEILWMESPDNVRGT